MTNLEKVQNLMDVMTNGKKTGNCLIWDKGQKRLVVKPAKEVSSSDAVPLGVEDMKVGLARDGAGQNRQSYHTAAGDWDHLRRLNRADFAQDSLALRVRRPAKNR